MIQFKGEQKNYAMVIAVPELSSLKTFLAHPSIDESPAWEFIDGITQQKPMPGVQHSRLQARLVGLINLQCEGFEALPELRCTMGDRSLVPDISILQDTQIPLDESELISRKGIEFAPPWVIEILSPDQSALQVTRKILFMLRQGTQLGWLIDPSEQVILVFEPDALPSEYVDDLELPVLDSIDLISTPAQIFSWLKLRP
jgi:Uma2 family endonuclease